MRRIAELIGRELEWVRTRALLRRDYELRTGDELVAVLSFQTFGSMATAESADGSWTFERVGFWQNKTVVRPLGANINLGLFKENKWEEGGTLEIPGGRRFTVATNYWDTEYYIKDEAGAVLILLSRRGLFRPSVSVTINLEATRLQEFPWLTMLGYYLMVMMEVDAANNR